MEDGQFTGDYGAAGPARSCRLALMTGRYAQAARTAWPWLKKPVELVEAHDPNGKLSLVDRKVFNCLLYYSGEALKASGASEAPLAFVARTADLRRDIGMKSSTNNSQILDSMRKLLQVHVDFSHGKVVNFAVPESRPLLEDFYMETGKGYLAWSFPPEFQLQPFDYERWSYLHVDVLAAFRSKYALILYEYLAALADRRHPQCTVTVEHLRAWLSLGGTDGDLPPELAGAAEKLSGWNALRVRALDPALREINRFAHFTVCMEAQNSAQGRRIEKVRFIVENKPGVRRGRERRLSGMAATS